MENTKRSLKSSIGIILLVFILVFMTSCTSKEESTSIDSEISDTATEVQKMAPDATVSSVGGEWAVLGLALSGTADKDSDYFDVYYDNVRATVKSKDGILSDRYYTEYARVVMALCAINKDPKDVEGYDLVTPLDDKEKVEAQGNVGIAYALIASNMANVRLGNEQEYLDIINNEIGDTIADSDASMVDYVAMMLQATSYYSDQVPVKNTQEAAIKWLSEVQNDSDGYGSLESDAEVIIALTSLGVNPMTDSRFIKKEISLYDQMMKFKVDGGFKHSLDDSSKEPNQMSTEKALLALDSIRLFDSGKKLYE